jgi:protein-S-isoprenylcysteine O-methyltransferase Ste14
MVKEETMKTQAKYMSAKTIVQLVFVVMVMPLLPMIISGAWNWWEAWAYAVLTSFGFIISRGLASRRHPDILDERARSMGLQGAKSWDKILAPAMALGSVFILIVAGVDKLNGWTTTPYSITAKVATLIVIVLGYILGTWAMVENKFFSGVVRIQEDRGHRVVATGPYRFIRHPGYAGTLWVYLLMPILFDSLWAFIPALLLFGVVILRTSLEDRTLQAELRGYAEYAQKTRYRLFPGIW